MFLSGIVLSGTNTTNIFWIQLNSKKGTPYSIDMPEYYLSERSIERRMRQGISIDSTDLPVNPFYLSSLDSLGFNVMHASRWMNGVVATLDSTVILDSIKIPAFVSSIELRKGYPLKSASNKFESFDYPDDQYYAHSFDQIKMLNGQIIHQFSKGKGIQIAVIDAGFKNSDSISLFKHIFEEGRIIGKRDIVNPGNDVYRESSHGTMVLSCMAMNLPRMMVGTAPEASYLLIRSEDALDEYPAEEDFWIIAAEFADSSGSDVINTSLGYTNFDNPDFNHNYGEFTGDSVRISKAANLAVKKGIVVVCSAGNDGSGLWRYISFPSEAKDVLCVASVDKEKNISYFSSLGFMRDTIILKPDVAAMGSLTSVLSPTDTFVVNSGTSFSSPLIAGMAACLVKLYPEKKASEIIDMIIKSGDRFPNHSNEYGFGIPDFGSLVPDEIDSTAVYNKNAALNQKFVYPNPFSSQINIVNSGDFIEAEILTLNGRKVVSSNINSGRAFFDLSNINDGLYLLRLKGANYIKTLKILKQN